MPHNSLLSVLQEREVLDGGKLISQILDQSAITSVLPKKIKLDILFKTNSFEILH